MDDTLQPLDAVQIKTHKHLLVGIAASVVLHLVCAFFLLGFLSGSPSPPSRSVTYIDLKTMPAPPAAPMTVPPKEVAAPKPLPEPEPLQPPVPVNPPQAQDPDPLQPQATATPEPPKAEEQLSRTTLGLGLSRGYFKSLREGQTLREGVKGYYLEMLQGINEKWWLDQQIDKRRLSPVVINITIARNGEIVGSEIMRSSGDRRFDKAVQAALAAASPLPPLPASYVGDTFEAPIRLVPPLNLMAW